MRKLREKKTYIQKRSIFGPKFLEGVADGIMGFFPDK